MADFSNNDNDIRKTFDDVEKEAFDSYVDATLKEGVDPLEQGSDLSKLTDEEYSNLPIIDEKPFEIASLPSDIQDKYDRNPNLFNRELRKEQKAWAQSFGTDNIDELFIWDDRNEKLSRGKRAYQYTPMESLSKSLGIDFDFIAKDIKASELGTDIANLDKAQRIDDKLYSDALERLNKGEFYKTQNLTQMQGLIQAEIDRARLNKDEGRVRELSELNATLERIIHPQKHGFLYGLGLGDKEESIIQKLPAVHMVASVFEGVQDLLNGEVVTSGIGRFLNKNKIEEIRSKWENSGQNWATLNDDERVTLLLALKDDLSQKVERGLWEQIGSGVGQAAKFGGDLYVMSRLGAGMVGAGGTIGMIGDILATDIPAITQIGETAKEVGIAKSFAQYAIQLAKAIPAVSVSMANILPSMVVPHAEFNRQSGELQNIIANDESYKAILGDYAYQSVVETFTEGLGSIFDGINEKVTQQIIEKSILNKWLAKLTEKGVIGKSIKEISEIAKHTAFDSIIGEAFEEEVGQFLQDIKDGGIKKWIEEAPFKTRVGNYRLLIEAATAGIYGGALMAHAKLQNSLFNSHAQVNVNDNTTLKTSFLDRVTQERNFEFSDEDLNLLNDMPDEIKSMSKTEENKTQEKEVAKTRRVELKDKLTGETQTQEVLIDYWGKARSDIIQSRWLNNILKLKNIDNAITKLYEEQSPIIQERVLKGQEILKQRKTDYLDSSAELLAKLQERGIDLSGKGVDGQQIAKILFPNGVEKLVETVLESGWLNKQETVVETNGVKETVREPIPEAINDEVKARIEEVKPLLEIIKGYTINNSVNNRMFMTMSAGINVIADYIAGRINANDMHNVLDYLNAELVDNGKAPIFKLANIKKNVSVASSDMLTALLKKLADIKGNNPEKILSLNSKEVIDTLHKTAKRIITNYADSLISSAKNNDYARSIIEQQKALAEARINSEDFKQEIKQAIKEYLNTGRWTLEPASLLFGNGAWQHLYDGYMMLKARRDALRLSLGLVDENHIPDGRKALVNEIKEEYKDKLDISLREELRNVSLALDGVENILSSLSTGDKSRISALFKDYYKDINEWAKAYSMNNRHPNYTHVVTALKEISDIPVLITRGKLKDKVMATTLTDAGELQIILNKKLKLDPVIQSFILTHEAGEAVLALATRENKLLEHDAMRILMSDYKTRGGYGILIRDRELMQELKRLKESGEYHISDIADIIYRSGTPGSTFLLQMMKAFTFMHPMLREMNMAPRYFNIETIAQNMYAITFKPNEILADLTSMFINYNALMQNDFPTLYSRYVDMLEEVPALKELVFKTAFYMRDASNLYDAVINQMLAQNTRTGLLLSELYRQRKGAMTAKEFLSKLGGLVKTKLIDNMSPLQKIADEAKIELQTRAKHLEAELKVNKDARKSFELFNELQRTKRKIKELNRKTFEMRQAGMYSVRVEEELRKHATPLLETFYDGVDFALGNQFLRYYDAYAVWKRAMTDPTIKGNVMIQRGMTKADAPEMIRQIEEEVKNKLGDDAYQKWLDKREIADNHVRALATQILELKKEYGLISEKVYKQIKNHINAGGDSYWVTFAREQFWKRGTSALTYDIKGGLSDVLEPVEMTIQSLENVIKTGELSKAKKSAIDIALIDGKAMRDYGVPGNPLGIEKVNWQKLSYYENGELITYWVAPEVAQPFITARPKDLANNRVVQAIKEKFSTANRFVKFSVFVVNMAARVMNIMQDTAGTMMFELGELPKGTFSIKDLTSAHARALKEMFTGLITIAKGGDIDRVLEPYYEAGVLGKDLSVKSSSAFDDIGMKAHALLDKYGLWKKGEPDKVLIRRIQEYMKQDSDFRNAFNDIWGQEFIESSKEYGQLLKKKNAWKKLLEGAQQVGTVLEAMNKIAIYHALEGAVERGTIDEYERKVLTNKYAGTPNTAMQHGEMFWGLNNIFLFAQTTLNTLYNQAEYMANHTDLKGKLMIGSMLGATYLSTVIHYLATYGILDKILGTDCNDYNNPDCMRWQRLYMGVSLRKSMYYTMIPVAIDEDGHGRFITIARPTFVNIFAPIMEQLARATAIKMGTNILPEMDRERLLGGSNKDALRDWFRATMQVATQMQDTFPSLTPILQIPMKALEVFMGQHEVRDMDTGALIASERDVKYGWKKAFARLTKWSFKKIGLTNYLNAFEIYDQVRDGNDNILKVVVENTYPAYFVKRFAPVENPNAYAQTPQEMKKIKEEIQGKEGVAITNAMDDVVTNLMAHDYKPTGKDTTIINRLLNDIAIKAYGKSLNELDKSQRQAIMGRKTSLQRQIVYRLHRKYGVYGSGGKPDKAFRALYELSVANNYGKKDVGYATLKAIRMQYSDNDFKKAVKYAYELGLLRDKDIKTLAENGLPELSRIIK